MPIDVNVIKSAFDDFEGENFVDAKEKLSGQFKVAKNDYLKKKLGLNGDSVQLPITTNMNANNKTDDNTDLEDQKSEITGKTRITRRSLQRKK